MQLNPFNSNLHRPKHPTNRAFNIHFLSALAHKLEDENVHYSKYFSEGGVQICEGAQGKKL